jgi:hypothetical protein
VPAPIAQRSACELVFKDEASAAIGVSIEAPQEIATNSDADGWLSDCAYWRHEFHDEVPIDVTLASGGVYLARFDEIRTQDGVVSLTGVGDEALFRLTTISGLDGPIGALFVRVGSTVIGLSLGIVDVTDSGGLLLAGDGNAQQQILTGLAAIAVHRLTSAAAPAAETCQLISVEQASQFTGIAISAAEELDNHDAWGPSCRYNSSDGSAELFISVNPRPTGMQNFDACKPTGEQVLGVGDDAYYDTSKCPILVGHDYVANPLMARTGNTVVAVGLGSQVDFDRAKEIAKEIGRLVLGNLGLNPGSTPAPVAGYALDHPCSLASELEVGATVGVPIATSYERSAVDGQEATCFYALADSNLYPLNVRLGTGQNSVREFNDEKAFEGFLSVDGIGDEALQSQVQIDSDQPLVTLHVRSGETLLDLSLGGNGHSTETFKVIAPGTPDEQLLILRQLAELMLPRLYTPNITPSPSPNSGTSLSLHVQVSHLGTRFEADGHCDIGPDDSWLYLGFQRSGQPEEYLTVGPAPNGVGGMSPKGGGVFHADSVRIALYDSATGALVFAENALAVLQPDLRGVNFNGLWNGATVDVFYTCQ